MCFNAEMQGIFMKPTSGRRIGVIAGIAAAIYGLLRCQPDWALQLFAAVPARLSAVFYSADMATEPGRWVFVTGGMEVSVTAACSGVTFFSILFGLLWWPKSGGSMGRDLLCGIRCLFQAYLLTLVANTMRIVTAVAMQRLLVIYALTEYEGAIHMLVGTVTFLPALILICWFNEKTVRHASFQAA